MYKLTNYSVVIRTADGAYIPFAEGNTDFASYKDWLVAGNIPEPADQILQKVPTSIHMAQARLVLLKHNLYQQVQEAFATLPMEAQIEWEFRTEVARSSPLVAALANLLQLSDTDLDALFLGGSQL